MKTILLSFLCFALCICKAQAQNQFDGIRSSQYLGVKSVFFNPANIAENPYRWDLNFFTLGAGAGDLNVSFNIKTLKNKMGNQTDSMLFGSNAKAASAYAGIDIMGPGFMLNISKKTSIAFTTRARVMVNIHDIDGKLVNAIQSGNNTNLPYTIASTGNQFVTANGWTDFGISLGQVLVEDGHHLLKAGITLKYLAGYSNNYLQLNQVSGTANQDANGTYLTAANGTVNIGEAGVDLSKLNGNNALQFKGRGAGTDIGFVYEYREVQNKKNKHAQNYKFKISLSLLDAGSIGYKANPSYTAGYLVNISDTQKFYLNSLKDSSLSGIKNALGQSPYFKNLNQGTNSYRVGLPTTLEGNMDLNLVNNFYLNLDGRLAFHNFNKYSNPYYQNNLTFTPRYESRYFGVYLPLNVNNLTGFNAGIGFRAGPFFFGSGSVLTSLLGSSRQADFYFGLHVGGLRK
jgi:hypothetical protein